MSDLYVYLEERFIFYDGKYYSLSFDNDFWSRYLSIFDRVFVVARVNKNNKSHSICNYREINIKNVHFIALPHYHGMFLGIFKLPLLLWTLFFCIKDSDFNMLRLPGIIGTLAGFWAIILKKNIAIELVGDPYDVFSSGVGGKFSKIFRYIFTKTTKFLAQKANAVAYVTEYTMQKKYPCSKESFSTFYSSIILPKKLFSLENIRDTFGAQINILLVGSLEQRYKGFDIALKAISKLSFRSECRVHLVGDGIVKNELIELVRELGMNEIVNFYGRIDRNRVLCMMEQMDLFLIPSRTEGLPRVLIEAMSKGLPAIGSNVGGIPELLEEEWLFASEDINGLSVLLEKMYILPSIKSISSRNMNKAREYEETILKTRRNNFYSYLKNLS